MEFASARRFAEETEKGRIIPTRTGVLLGARLGSLKKSGWSAES
jgi:hypothetical protein